MPWNWSRAEQRVGRVDRIGGKPEVHITNMFYKGTVETDVYEAIRDRFGDFTKIVGKAQPILAAIETKTKQAAFGEIDIKDVAVSIEELAAEVESMPVSIGDLETQSIQSAPEEWSDAPTLSEIERVITGYFTESIRRHSEREGVYVLDHGSGEDLITFDRTILAEYAPEVSLFVPGHVHWSAVVEQPLEL